MPNWLPIVIGIVVPLIVIAINAWVNLEIKFAPTRDAAVYALRRIPIRISGWVMNALNVGLLIFNVSSSEPVTRWAVFQIALQIGSLVFVIVMSVINRTSEALADTAETLRRHVTVTTETIEKILKKSE